MPTVDRFTVSLDTELLAAFDRFIADRGYENRSEAVRDMIRDLLVADRLATGREEVAAFLTFVCDHRLGDAFKRMRGLLRANAEMVSGWLNLPLDDHHDAMAVAFRGPSDRVRAAAEQVQALRGVSHGRLSAVPIGGLLPEA
jgi:CopG family nickel-responsive transcriptional regulator